MLSKIRQKYRRLIRHLSALLRYWTLRRLWNIILVETERILGKSELRGRPYIIIVDPVNSCNLRCPFCPTGRGDLPLKPGKMPLDKFKKVVDASAQNVIKMILYNWGEPFLHKDILSMIQYAHSKRISTAVSTNLNLMPDGGGEAVVRSGLDDLILSCDGLSQETYEIYRRGGNLEKVLSNLKDVSTAKKRLNSRSPVIEFQFLVFKHNEHEVPHVEAFAKEHGADFVRLTKPYVNLDYEEIKHADNPEFVRRQYLQSTGSESIELDIFSPEGDQEACALHYKPPIECFWPWRSMVINWNGQVDPCCGKNYRQSFGNIFEQSLSEIWNNRFYRYARAWIKGKAENDPEMKIVCRGCPGYK